MTGKVAKLVSDERSAARDAAPDEPRPPEFSDEALATQFADDHEEDLLYVSSLAMWVIWNYNRWRPDDTLRGFSDVRKACRAAAARCNDLKLAKAIASAATVAAVERLARADQRLAARPTDFDADPWVINTPEGLIDLRTGDIRQARREDMVTKMTAVGPGRACTLWREFLRRITDGNSELERFIARSFGYALTGVTREHALFFDYGLGASGKTVKNETFAGLLGDYAMAAPIEMFTASKFERHSTDVAALQGARFVTASETEAGRALAEARIKLLTGGETISARRMRRDNISFKPQFKLFITGNHKPRIASHNEAMARRIHLTPFEVTIPQHERDPKLGERLVEEWPGILSWALDGCLEWQRIGLAPPGVVRDATARYIEAEDTFGKWLGIATDSDPNSVAKTSDLFGSWRSYALEAREEIGTLKDFTEVMEARGFVNKHTREGNRWLGLKIRET